MESIQIKDFLQYKYLSNVKYAPDGKKAAFVVANCNEDENSYESRLWLYDGAVKQLSDIGKEGGYIWEDENTILWFSLEERMGCGAGFCGDAGWRLPV